MISLGNRKLGIRKRCLLVPLLFTRNAVIKKKKDNIDESSRTFAKDLINNSTDLKICLKVTSMQRVLTSKTEKN